MRNLETVERFVISSNSPHEPNANDDDDEVTYVVRSSVSDPAILTTVVATTVVADTSAPIPRAGHGLGVDGSAWYFLGISVSPSVYMDSDTLRKIYIPKWNVINDSTIDDPKICPRQRFEERCALQVNRLKERDAEIAMRVRRMQDEQDRVLGDRVLSLGGLKLVIMKFLQSPRYLDSLGEALGRAIDKGMQDGLKAGVDHGRAGRGLDVITAYDPSAEPNFIFVVDALRAVFVSHTCHWSLERMRRIKWMYWENLLSFALVVDHSHIQRLKGDVAACCRLSLTDAMIPLLEPLSIRSLTGEASTSMVPSAAVTTALSTTFVQASTIPLLPSTEVPSSPKIVFEEEELNTTPEHTSAP
ncbi:hypothetical protein Tco_0471436 [Tanacetum coccineum]